MHDKWRRIKLGEAATFLSGGTPKKSREDYWGGEIPWISGKTLVSGPVETSERRLTELGAREGSRIAPQGATLLLVRGMSLLQEVRVGRASRPVAFNQDVKALVPNEEFDETFFSYAIEALRPQLLRLVHQASHGTGVLETGAVKSTTIPVPALSEQRRIVGVLGALDDLADLEVSQAEAMSQLAQALVSTAASTVSLSELGEEVRQSLRPEGSCDHFSLPAFDDGALPIREDGSSIKSSKNRVSCPSVLISRLNPHIPRVWMAYPSDQVPSVASTEFVVVKPSGAPVEWIWACASSQPFLAQMQGRVTGTTGSHQRVDKRAIMALTVADPAQASDCVVEAVVALVRDSDAARQEAARLHGVREELLPLLMSGRVRVGEVAV